MEQTHRSALNTDRLGPFSFGADGISALMKRERIVTVSVQWDHFVKEKKAYGTEEGFFAGQLRCIESSRVFFHSTAP